MVASILLITKNYPPQIGWMEKYAFDLHQNLLKNHQVFLLKSGPRRNFMYKSKILYVIYDFFRLLLFLFKVIIFGPYFSRKSDIIWSIDGSVWILGLYLKIFSKDSQTRVTIHGKDLSWSFPGYSFLLSFVLRKTDSIYLVSDFLKKNLITKFPYISQRKLLVTAHSYSSLTFYPALPFEKDLFLKAYNIPSNKILLFSLGRFVPKKWFDWFLEEVLPYLSPRFHYVLWWFGPLESIIQQIVIQKKISNCTLLWPINDSQEKAKFFTSADYFIMSNISDASDLEWFGLVLLEAQFYSKKIILSDADWLNERVPEGAIVLPSKNALSWIKAINNLPY